MGVFGAVSLPPERLKEELDWIDAHALTGDVNAKLNLGSI